MLPSCSRDYVSVTYKLISLNMASTQGQFDDLYISEKKIYGWVRRRNVENSYWNLGSDKEKFYERYRTSYPFGSIINYYFH
jgi:hypothetical protein